MVCDTCQTKLKKSSQMDMFKGGSADGKSHKIGRHGDDRQLNENKLLSKNRFGNMKSGLKGGGSKNCRLCKGMLHANQELYCQHCAFKNGLCTMCGVKVMNTSMYASGQVSHQPDCVLPGTKGAASAGRARRTAPLRSLWRGHYRGM